MMPLVKHYTAHFIVMIHLRQYHQYTVRYTRPLHSLRQVVFVPIYAVHKYRQLVIHDHVLYCLWVYAVYV